MADISKIKLPNGTTYDIKDTTARSAAGGDFVYSNSNTTAESYAGADSYTVPETGYYSFIIICKTTSGVSSSKNAYCELRAGGTTAAYSLIGFSQILTNTAGITFYVRTPVVHIKAGTPIKTVFFNAELHSVQYGFLVDKWTQV